MILLLTFWNTEKGAAICGFFQTVAVISCDRIRYCHSEDAAVQARFLVRRSKVLLFFPFTYLFFSPLHVAFLDVHCSSASQSRTSMPRCCSPGIKVLHIYCPLCWRFRSKFFLTHIGNMQLNWLCSKQTFHHEHWGKKEKTSSMKRAHLLLPMIFYFLVLFDATLRFTSEVENSVAEIYSNDPPDSCHCMAWCPTAPVERRDAQTPSSYIYKRMKLMIITETSG